MDLLIYAKKLSDLAQHARKKTVAISLSDYVDTAIAIALYITTILIIV